MRLLLLTAAVFASSTALASAQTSRTETIAVQQPQIHIQETNFHRDLSLRSDPARTNGWDVRVGVEVEARSLSAQLQNVRVEGRFRGSLDRLYARLNAPPLSRQPERRPNR